MISGVVILGMIMSILDTTIVNVALDTLSKDLHSSISEVQWVVTGYLLALAAVMPVTGWMARRFGAKRVYLVSLALFTLGSIAVRALEHARRARRLPRAAGHRRRHDHAAAQLIMAQVAGPQRMGRVMGVVSMPAMLAPILGPVVGGLILQNLHWSWIFFVNAPIGAIAIYLGWRMLPETDSGEAGRSTPGPGAASRERALTIFGISELAPARRSARSKCSRRSSSASCWGWPSACTRFGSAAAARRASVQEQSLRRRVVHDLRAGRRAVRGDDPCAALLPEVRHLSVIDTGLLNGPRASAR